MKRWFATLAAFVNILDEILKMSTCSFDLELLVKVCDGSVKMIPLFIEIFHKENEAFHSVIYNVFMF